MKARIQLPEDRASTRVELGGVNVADSVRTLRLDAEPAETPILILELPIFDIVVDGEVRVDIPEETRELLVKLGWTPPQEDQ